MPREETPQLLERLAQLETNTYHNDFLLTWKKSADELKAALTIAEILENLWRANVDARVFRGGLAVSLFRDKSTRTRFSFASATSLLGMSLMDLDETKSQVAHGETVRETANMISFLTEVIGIRDDMFLGEGHTYMAEVAESVDWGFKQGILPQRPAIINLQCDQDHPTQSLCDLLHLKQTYGSLEALKGKKIAMTWAYSPSYGKPLSVAQGIINLMSRYGMEVVLAHPEGYDVIPEHLEIAGGFAKESGGSFKVTHDMAEAFRDADIVYPKSWAPYTVMEERTRLLRGGEAKKLEELEKQALANNASHKDWECTEKLMELTRGGKGLYMHCLPADITGVSCEAGEVAASVFDRYRNPTYHEAEHKLYIIAAMMMMCRFEKPAEVLKKVVERNLPRRWD